MGKLILCSGSIAKEPYCFKATDTKIYSMEELCYYIYNNVYILSEEMFDEILVVWLSHQVHMEEISGKLRILLRNHNSLKDIVVSILCSTDYYAEKEIRKLLVIMDEMDQLRPIYRTKIKGDNYLRYKNYAAAKEEYESMLNKKEAAELTTEEYGNILHNLGVVYINISSYGEAAVKFKEAFSRNQREESLKQYLFALKLGKYEEEFQSEILHFQIPKEVEEAYLREMEEAMEEAMKTPLYRNVQLLEEIKKEGKVNEYYKKIDDIIWMWMQKYKSEAG